MASFAPFWRDRLDDFGKPMMKRSNPAPARTGTETARVPTLGEIGLSQFAPYLLNRITASYNAGVAEDLKQHGMTTLKLRILAALSISAGVTVNELAVLAVTEQSTLSRTLDGMEEDGLISRTPSAEDMRAKHVHLTEQGRAAFNELWPIMHGRFEKMFHGVSDEDYRGFVACLQTLLRNA